MEEVSPFIDSPTSTDACISNYAIVFVVIALFLYIIYRYRKGGVDDDGCREKGYIEEQVEMLNNKQIKYLESLSDNSA